jgi:nitrate reductase delta subunit
MFALLQSPRVMAHSLRVLAALLAYPDARLRADLPEMRALLHAEAALSASRRGEIGALMDAISVTEPLRNEADYVELFDRGRATSLHLFEHVHGDSRERGPAMIDLGLTYERAGLSLKEGELPDYLPAVLEFVSTQPPREARAFLAEMSHLFNAIFGALQQQRSAYASVLAGLLDLAGETAQAVTPPPEVPIDERWAEPVAFDACSSQGQSRPDQPQPIHLVRQAAGETPGGTHRSLSVKGASA